MGWLQSVGSIKLYVSFAEYRFFYKSVLQKRPIILSMLLTTATPYVNWGLCQWINRVSAFAMWMTCYVNDLLCEWLDCVLRHELDPPKNGVLALWPNTRVVKCKYDVSQKQNGFNCVSAFVVQMNDLIVCYVKDFIVWARLFCGWIDCVLHQWLNCVSVFLVWINQLCVTSVDQLCEHICYVNESTVCLINDVIVRACLLCEWINCVCYVNDSTAYAHVLWERIKCVSTFVMSMTELLTRMCYVKESIVCYVNESTVWAHLLCQSVVCYVNDSIAYAH